MSVPKAIFTPAFTALRNDTSCSDARLRSRWPAGVSPGAQSVVVNTQRRAEPGALPDHLRDLRVGQHQPMLDRIAAAIERALQAFSAVSVASDLFSPAMSLVHNRTQFLHSQSRLRYQFAVFSDPRPMRHIHFDPVGAVVKLLARGLTRLDRSVNDLHPLGHFDLGRVTLQRISAGCRDGARRNKQTRSGNVSAFNRHLDAHVAVTRTFGFHVAQRGEALFERPPHRDRRPRRAKRQRILQQLNVVSALGGIFSLKKNVRVGVDQPGKHRGLREIDEGGARWEVRRSDRSRVDDLGNHIPANSDDLVAASRNRHAIDQQFPPGSPSPVPA